MLRRLAFGLTATILALGAVVVVLIVFSNRDQSGVKGQQASAPGRAVKLLPATHRAPGAGFRYSSTPPTSGPHAVVRVPGDGRALSDDQILTALESGNVVVLYPGGAPPAALRAIQQTVAGGATTPALVKDGQAVLLGTSREAGGRTLALAWGRLLTARGPSDKSIGAFADYWLGGGAPGGK